MQPYDLVVHGGTLVTEAGTTQADLCVRDGRIAWLGAESRAAGRQVIDARGKLVLPGVVDAHVHLQLLQQGRYPTADNFASGTGAAAAGGITTIVDFCSPDRPGQSLWEAYEARRALADPQVLVDYGLHCAPAAGSDLAGEMDRLIDCGVTSFKFFQVYDGLARSDGELYQAFELVASRHALATLHAENRQLVDLLTGRLRQGGERAALNHARSRPPLVEASAIHTAVQLAEAAGVNLHIVHLSCREGLGVVREAQARGLPILAETAPQYLVLDERDLARAEGNLYLCTPPLRDASHQEVLWSGLSDGAIQIVATDHCTFTKEQKLSAEAFWAAPGGVGSMEFLLPLLYTEGVCRGRLRLTRLVQLLCHHPARIFGLAPRKGFLELGSDADLVIFDPAATYEAGFGPLHGGSDYSCYTGMKLCGRVEITVSRGEVIYQSGNVVGTPGRGRYLPRDLAHPTALLRLAREGLAYA